LFFAYLKKAELKEKLSEPIDNHNYLFWKASLKYKTTDGDTNKQKVNSKKKHK
jgi:hypothetical protein